MNFSVQSYPLWNRTGTIENREIEGYGVSIDGDIFEYRDRTISEKKAVMKAVKEWLGV